MADFNTYDPTKVIVVWNGIRFVGFASGSMVNCERTNDSFTDDVGTQGDVVVVRSRDMRGTATVTLQQSSPTNTLLSAQMKASELSGLVTGDLSIEDQNGNTLVKAEQSWLRKPPGVEYSDELSNREWVIACAELIMDVGGNE